MAKKKSYSPSYVNRIQLLLPTLQSVQPLLPTQANANHKYFRHYCQPSSLPQVIAQYSNFYLLMPIGGSRLFSYTVVVSNHILRYFSREVVSDFLFLCRHLLEFQNEAWSSMDQLNGKCEAPPTFPLAPLDFEYLVLRQVYTFFWWRLYQLIDHAYRFKYKVKDCQYPLSSSSTI